MLTPDYLMSVWTEMENALVSTLDPGARQRRLLPLLLKKCDVPLRLRSLVYIDLTASSNSQAQLQHLARNLLV